MALTLGPPTWATGSWATDAWADGSWDVDAVVSGDGATLARRIPLFGLMLRGLRAPDFK